MKQAFLKIAGAKTDAQFYKLFPSEASFFKKHPEARDHIKKAQNGLHLVNKGLDINDNGIPDEYESMEDIQNTQNNSISKMSQYPKNIPNQYGIGAQTLQKINPAQNFTDTFFKPTNTIPQIGADPVGAATSKSLTKSPDMLSKMGGADGLLDAGIGAIQGFSMLEDGKKERNIARQFNEYSQVALRASGSRDVDANNRRKYNRPEDNVITGEQFFPVNGVGTNVLAKNGIQIAANGLEMLPEEGFDYANAGAMGSQLYNGLTGNQMSGGAKIGGSLGKLAGTAFGGPIGGAVGEFLGNAAGGLADTTARDTRKFQASSQHNIDLMNTNLMFQSYQNRNSHVLENGGELSDLEESGELQTLWGGEAEQLSHNPYHGETVMFKGQSHDEEDAEGNSGIGINYGNSPVEVEKGEPASVLPNPETGEDNLVVFGNLKIPKFAHDILQDPKAKDKKFKNYVADLSKEESKLNKYMESSKNTINSLEGNTSFDKLELESNNLKVKGAMIKLKDISEKKQQLSKFQNIINDTADENGLVAADLAKGKITRDKSKMNSLKEAMNGYNIPKAQGGITTNGKNLKKLNVANNLRNQSQNKDGLFGDTTQSDYENFKNKNTWYDFTNFDPKNKTNVLDFQNKFKNLAKEYNYDASYFKNDGAFGEQTVTAEGDFFIPKAQKHEVTPDAAINETDQNTINNTKPALDKPPTNSPIVEYKRNKYMDAFNQVLPFIRPSNATPLDGNELLGEMYGMSSNQLEPVQSQNFRPDLRTPYDISFQDQINEVTAGQRGAQRATMNSPEVQSDMAATAYNSKAKILAEQFRANQGFKEQIYSGNTATLNGAQEKNLEINDKQYTRQEQAKSNTKAINQALLNSISSKYQQNKLENRTLGIQENLYNYRFDKYGRAFNINGFYQPNVSQANNNYDKNGKATSRNVFDSNGNIINTVPLEDDNLSPVAPAGATQGINPNIQNTKKRNGGYITNGSIVKSLK